MDNKHEMITKLVKYFDLKPLPHEGGLFTETYKSTQMIPQSALAPRYHSGRACGTAILYLLSNDVQSFSVMHRLLTDEIYHFYLGDPVEMLLLYPGGRGETVILGTDVLGGQRVQFVVPAGVWQGSHLQPGGQYALIGTTMAPGYENEDFQLASRQELASAYPAAASLIHSLTRSGVV